MNTVKYVSEAFRKELSVLYDVREIDSLCLIALSEITGITSTKIKAFPELEIPADKSEEINKILIRLKTGEPIQYILGHTEFYGLSFKVNPSVLIPRPETEELVEWAINSWQLLVSSWQTLTGNILDIGTGSGCIAVSLKKNIPGAIVSAIDISPEALKIAKENAELNGADINFIQADILDLTNQSLISNHYSLILSNPPYVTPSDKKQMHANVIDFEPHTALFVTEDDPLIFYKTIIDFATDHLEKGGLLFFEINENYGEQIVELLTHRSFKNIELRKDLSRKNRMVRALISGS